MPSERLLLGGSRRYPPAVALHWTPGGCDVLALLPLDLDQSRKLLAAIGRVESARKNEFGYWSKPIPQ